MLGDYILCLLGWWHLQEDVQFPSCSDAGSTFTPKEGWQLNELTVGLHILYLMEVLLGEVPSKHHIPSSYSSQFIRVERVTDQVDITPEKKSIKQLRKCNEKLVSLWFPPGTIYPQCHPILSRKFCLTIMAQHAPCLCASPFNACLLHIL